jgi:hypothetical protein
LKKNTTKQNFTKIFVNINKKTCNNAKKASSLCLPLEPMATQHNTIKMKIDRVPHTWTDRPTDRVIRPLIQLLRNDTNTIRRGQRNTSIDVDLEARDSLELVSAKNNHSTQQNQKLISKPT